MPRYRVVKLVEHPRKAWLCKVFEIESSIPVKEQAMDLARRLNASVRDGRTEFVVEDDVRTGL